MLTSVDARRRWFGTFFLIVAGGMLLWGFTFLAAFLVKQLDLATVRWLVVAVVVYTGLMLLRASAAPAPAPAPAAR